MRFGPDPAAFFHAYYRRTVSFFTQGHFEAIYEFLFLYEHFPVLFFIRSTWLCLQVRSFHHKIDWRKSLLLALTLTFVGRTLTAFCARRGPFLDTRSLYIFILIGIWYLVNCSPGDVIFKFLNRDIFWVAFQILHSIIQVRQVCHGADIGLLVLTEGGAGAVLLSAVLASTECVIWIMVTNECRTLSNAVIMRNLVTAIVYCAIAQNPDLARTLGEVGKMDMKLLFAAAYVAIAVLDMAWYGVRGRKGIDVTLLSYLGLCLNYHGGK
jgi:hypothetical protein